MERQQLIYFDSCIWIGIITGEQRKDPSETAALAGLVRQLDDQDIIVVCSTLVYVEVLEADMTDRQKAVFQALLNKRSVVQIKDPIRPIMAIAAEIRSYYKALKNKGDTGLRPPGTPDAIHLATAIYYECDAFFTLDEKNKPGGCGLLKMQNPIAGMYALHICKPYVSQPGPAV